MASAQLQAVRCQHGGDRLAVYGIQGACLPSPEVATIAPDAAQVQQLRLRRLVPPYADFDGGHVPQEEDVLCHATAEIFEHLKREITRCVK